MTNSKLVCLSAVVAVLAGAMALPAVAQTAPPSPTPSSPPAVTKPDAAPMPQTPPAAQRPAPRPEATAPAKVNPLVGLVVFSSDGTKLGTVQDVRTNPDGKATAIHIKTGGLLGLGGKVVAISDGKFTKAGDRVQLSMTSEEVSKLPEIKDNS